MNLDNFKVVILAGGLGTRISEYTKDIPKPMIEIKNKPILIQILKIYIKSGINNFIIATGYKNQVIKKFFKRKISDWNVKIVNTGINTMTGGRLKRLKKFIENQTFMLTYGDGLCDVNIKKLHEFHIKNRSIAILLFFI